MQRMHVTVNNNCYMHPLHVKTGWSRRILTSGIYFDYTYSFRENTGYMHVFVSNFNYYSVRELIIITFNIIIIIHVKVYSDYSHNTLLP